MQTRPNILLITADQWRGDCLGAAGHPAVLTPNIDRLAGQGTRFARHYAPCAPCSPARASLHTGLYQMNHRVVWNGAGLDARFDNAALAARRAGYRPTLFGYTDTAPDPRCLPPGDPALRTYEGVLPGFELRQGLPEDEKPWISWLRSRGHDVASSREAHSVPPEPGERVSLEPPCYGAEETQTAFLTAEFLRWLDEQEAGKPWFAHISYLRPHPPFAVPEPYNRMYDVDDLPDPCGVKSAEAEAVLHPFLAAFREWQDLGNFLPGASGSARELSTRDWLRLRAIYFGMISEVDAQIGRVMAGLVASDCAEETLVVFTSDHGEMLGDHLMLGKGGFFEQSYHVPLIIRMPGGAGGGVVEAFTSATDIFPTLCAAMGVSPGHQPDGMPLQPFLEGRVPEGWRDAAFWEFDFRQPLGPEGARALGLREEECVLTCYRDRRSLYVQSPALAPLLFDLDSDPECRVNRAGDRDLLERRLDCAEALLAERARHADNTLARCAVWDYHRRDDHAERGPQKAVRRCAARAG